MSTISVTLHFIDGSTETATAESCSARDGVLTLTPPGYGYSYNQPLRRIPLISLREWTERRHP